MHLRYNRSPFFNLGFTLIELLVVIAIIAILSVVVILVLNPVDLLRQSRDSNRISDMASLNTAIGIFASDQSAGSLGAVNTVYVSVPDPVATSTAGDQCQGLGLPALPAIYTYQCATSSTYRRVDGTGWIPVRFTQISAGAPFSLLPIDQVNTTSARSYYSYITNGTQFEVTAPLESAKYKAGGSGDVISNDGGPLSSVYEKGSKLGLMPIDYGDNSLVGYWTFEEGSSSVAYDYSGNNITSTWSGTPSGSSGYYSAGKTGSYAGSFNGTDDSVNLGNPASLNLFNNSQITLSAWVKLGGASAGNYPSIISKGSGDFTGAYAAQQGFVLMYSTAAQDGYGNIRWGVGNGSGYDAVNYAPGDSVVLNSWHHIVGTANNATINLYFDGALVSSLGRSYLGSLNTVQNITIGQWLSFSRYFNGAIDNIRIYNRALSASEVAGLYAGGK